MNKKSNILNIISWIFGIVFFVVGVLNVILVHFVPGMLYLLISVIYLPPTNTILGKRFDLSIPNVVKIILGIVVLWGTLAVGDLAEMFGL